MVRGGGRERLGSVVESDGHRLFERGKRSRTQYGMHGSLSTIWLLLVCTYSNLKEVDFIALNCIRATHHTITGLPIMGSCKLKLWLYLSNYAA